MQIHDLKIDPQPFADLVSGAKKCEVRNDDRGFEVGDTVRFPGGHCCTISHIQRGYGLPDGLCVLSYAQAIAAPEQEVSGKNAEDAAHELALKVREALDRTSCPDAWMRIAYESVVKEYTHADSSEVERLRAENIELSSSATSWRIHYDRACTERDDVRQKLADAQALLNVVKDWVLDREISGVDAIYLIKQIDAFLSATAQPAEVETQPTGHDQLWGWFGLSRSTWLAIPRVLMHAMPDDWQQKMAALMSQWDETWDTSDLPGTQITGVRSNRFAAWPHWLMEYRHPDHAEIEARRRKPANGRFDAAQPTEVKS